MELKTDKARQEAMNLALMSAMNKSNRSGFGWVLLDEEVKRLSSGSFVIGQDDNTDLLINSIRDYIDELSHLIITCDPVIAFIDVEALCDVLELSSCRTVTIGYHDNLINNEKWTQWQHDWSGEVLYMPPTQVSERLNAGPKKLIKSHYPWLTGLSISAVSGHAMAFSDLSHEFGFNAFLKELANKSRAVLFTPSQENIISILEGKNLNLESHCFYQVESLGEVIAALNECVLQQRTNVLLFSDLRFLQTVIQAELCDEIIHHIGFESVEKERAEEQPVISPFENWSIVNSEVVGQCVRLTLGHLDEIKNLAPSGMRLN